MPRNNYNPGSKDWYDREEEIEKEDEDRRNEDDNFRLFEPGEM